MTEPSPAPTSSDGRRSSGASETPPDIEAHTIRLRVNQRDLELAVPTDRLLIDLLRTDLGLTGTKEGCGVGVCGACSIILDGQLLSSCIVLAVTTDGAEITTIEGLAGPGDPLVPIQEAFLSCGGYQCGICTPGQLMAATALLEHTPDPTEAEVRAWMTGNLCRCTGYRQIVDAILLAAGSAVAGSVEPATARVAASGS
jgi:carbon-monoxide dehydrogenase small subunit